MIQDLAPLPLAPIFRHGVEDSAMEALNILIVVHGRDGSSIQAEHLVKIQSSVTGLVDCLFPIVGETATFEGSESLDGNDYIHPVKVAALAALIGRRLGMPRSAIINLATAAVLMNVGYLRLRRSLMDEPRRLLGSEWEEHVHTHPDGSVGMLAESGLNDACLRTIAEHHERMDGSGYPGGLLDEAISLDARILAVADTYVSLRSIRAHRPMVDVATVLTEITGASGTLFDPTVVEAFRWVIDAYAGIKRPDRIGLDVVGDAAARGSVGTSSRQTEQVKPQADREDGRERREREETSELRPSPRLTARTAPAGPPALVRAALLPPRPAPAREGAVARIEVRVRSSADAARDLRCTAVRRPTLFSAGFYLDQTVRGRWFSDDLGLLVSVFQPRMPAARVAPRHRSRRATLFSTAAYIDERARADG